MVRRVLSVLVLGALGSAGIRADGPARLVGTWTLTAVEHAAADGAWIVQPLPRGVLILNSGGNAFELAETGRRVPCAGNQPTHPEAHEGYKQCAGLWGR